MMGSLVSISSWIISDVKSSIASNKNLLKSIPYVGDNILSPGEVKNAVATLFLTASSSNNAATSFKNSFLLS